MLCEFHLISNIVKNKILELQWRILPHPPYSLDHAPSDYHLFRSLQSELSEKNYEKLLGEDVKTDLAAFFT
jgi:histone-lysine N-methyltransferase SETMAR